MMKRLFPIAVVILGTLGVAHGQSVSTYDSSLLSLASVDRKIADLDVEESAIKRDLGSLDEQIQKLENGVRSRSRAFYKVTRMGSLPLSGGFDEFMQHASHVERSRHLLLTEVRDLREYRSKVIVLGTRLELNHRDHDRFSAQRTTLLASRVATADEARREDSFDKAFTSPTSGAGDYVAVYGSSASGPADHADSSFSAAKGRLLFPVPGRAEVRAAKREESNGPAVEIRAPLGSPVRAVFGGRVAFADRYGSYGRIVILDHGDHFYTVSGNLASIDVHVGDELSAGERVGTVGDDGKGPALYFEVRKGTQTVAPGPWLGL